MQDNISWPLGDFLKHAWGETAQYCRRRNQPLSVRDELQLRREAFPFMGDSESSTGALLPPLAWTLMWRGTYSNLYGYYVGDMMRRWGYIMWDAPRLERTGAKEVLARQWEDYWTNDPRDQIIY